ncbi:MAG: hypothetical protein ACXVFM_17110 [Solirubrobacteraceae bacterium]
MRVLPPLAALVLGAATALLVACGGSDGRIPASNASSLTSALSQISSDYRAGRCAAAQRAVIKAQNDVLALPDTVDARLRQRLQSGIQNLAAKVPATCSQSQTQTQQTTTNTTTTDTGTTDTGTTDTGTTDTGTTGTDTGTPPTTSTGTTGTSSTGTTTGTDTGTGGTSVGGVTTP